MDLESSLERLGEQAPDLAADVQSLHGLGGVMAWMTTRGIALAQAEIVQQDEFSLDFVVPLAPEPRWLVFAVT
jgi:hypothetical protein